jgi:putative endopeptidase
MGHELTHAFDDEGSQFDAQGNLRNWWTDADRKEFEQRAQCVVDQYSGYTIIDDIKINGKTDERRRSGGSGRDAAGLSGVERRHEGSKAPAAGWVDAGAALLRRLRPELVHERAR